MANNQEKYHEPIILKKRNMISYLFLRNPKIFVIFQPMPQRDITMIWIFLRLTEDCLKPRSVPTSVCGAYRVLRFSSDVI